jgi:hypothetical protein
MRRKYVGGGERKEGRGALVDSEVWEISKQEDVSERGGERKVLLLLWLLYSKRGDASCRIFYKCYTDEAEWRKQAESQKIWIIKL